VRWERRGVPAPGGVGRPIRQQIVRVAGGSPGAATGSVLVVRVRVRRRGERRGAVAARRKREGPRPHAELPDSDLREGAVGVTGRSVAGARGTARGGALLNDGDWAGWDRGHHHVAGEIEDT
jgi:hypothetical protein